MAKVNFKRRLTNEEVDELPVEDGSLIITKEGSLFIDYDEERKQIQGGKGADYDSLPVGSVIDFEGTEIPEGYEEVENKKVLFNGKENNSLILNEDVNNYSKLLIIFCANNVYNSIIVDNPDGKTISLFTSYMVDANTLKISSKNITLSGTTISIGNYMEWNNTWGNSNITSSKSNSIYITKIIGYKQEVEI